MAKLPRKTQKIFCSKPTSENQTSVFGTMKTADKQYSTDVGTLQSNAAYEQGWKSATIANYKPFMEDFNTLNYINTSQLAYLFQQGIPEWDESTAYYKNSFCSYNGDLWKSLIDDNLNNTPLEGEAWTLFTSGKKSGGGLELCDIGTALYVDETKGLRRRLNGSIMDITSNYQAFLTRLLEIKTTNPDYFTDEATWQSEATLNVDGCVYKFVLNYDSTGTNVVSVRLPKYPDYVEINAGGTLPVVGNGMTLGFTTGSENLGIGSGQNNVAEFLTSFYGQTIPYTYTSGAVPVGINKAFGLTTDPTKSGIQTTLKQTKLKLRYFIQIATGSETENNIINDIELNNPYSLFDSKYSDHELNNLSWLRSEGQWNSKAVYPTAYDKLLKVYNGTETIEGLSVKLNTETYTDYDFVLNTADETFRLPLKTKLASGKAVVGNGMTLGLTDGTNYGGLGTTSSNGVLGNISAFYGQKVGSATNHPYIGGDIKFGLTTDPTKSGIELSDSNLYLYFYVGETVQNANLIDAGRIGEQLAGKQDKCIHIIDTYVNGTSGYRIWSDGYCEQWGKANGGVTVTFIKTFKDKNYNLTSAFVDDTSSNGATWGYMALNNRTANGFTISSNGAIQLWKACGYLAEGEY